MLNPLFSAPVPRGLFSPLPQVGAVGVGGGQHAQQEQRHKDGGEKENEGVEQEQGEEEEGVGEAGVQQAQQEQAGELLGGGAAAAAGATAAAPKPAGGLPGLPSLRRPLLPLTPQQAAAMMQMMQQQQQGGPAGGMQPVAALALLHSQMAQRTQQVVGATPSMQQHEASKATQAPPAGGPQKAPSALTSHLSDVGRDMEMAGEGHMCVLGGRGGRSMSGSCQD